MSYNVGQVLYLIHNEKRTVIPVQVVEQILRRSLEGERTTYMVQLPSPRATASDPRELDSLPCEVYESLDDVKTILVKNARVVIDELISKASSLANTHFSNGELAETERPLGQVDVSDVSTDTVRITLDDGTIANVKIPQQ